MDLARGPFPKMETLVIRPPPGLSQKSGNDPNLCAYAKPQDSNGRHQAAQRIMNRLGYPLARLVFVDDECDYEFRRDRQTGIISKEILIKLDEEEWAWVE